MAEEPGLLLSSQMSIENRVDTVLDRIMNRFGNRLIDSDASQPYFLGIERYDFSDIRIWFYDSLKTELRYGLHCSFVQNLISSSLVKDLGNDEVVECATRGRCDLYVDYRTRYHATVEDLLIVIDEMATALITENRHEILSR